MTSNPSAGYTQHSTKANTQYVSWKGSGVNQFPTANTPGTIRPFTNNDPGNVFLTGFGLPRPIKHFRKGRSVVHYQELEGTANPLIVYNVHRYVKSSKLHDVLDRPGAFAVQQNPEFAQFGLCEEGCQAIQLTANYKPNQHYWNDNPNPATTNPTWCCNPERKARRRSMYATTNLSKQYCTSSTQYLQQRCKTFDQKAFNFVSPESGVDNTYLANCQPITGASALVFVQQVLAVLLTSSVVNSVQVAGAGVSTVQGLFRWLQQLPDPISREKALNVFAEMFQRDGAMSFVPACPLTVYKPNNPQFAQQGAVSSSTRLLKLNVNTISTHNASLHNNNNVGDQLVTSNDLYAGEDNRQNPWKTKVPNCNATPPLNMRQTRPHTNNKRYCKIDGGENY